MAAAISVGAQAKGAGAVLRVTGAAPRSFVIVDGIRHGRVGDDGSREIRTIPAGRHVVVVRQLGFADAEQTVALAAAKPTVVTPKRVPTTDEAELAFQRAEDLAADGKHDEAVAQFQAAISARGKLYREARIGLAREFLTLKKTDEATAALEPVIDADPRDIEAHTVLGSVLRERGLYDESAAEFRKAIAIAPAKSPEAHTGLAVVLAETGDHAGAVKEYRTAISQNQDAEPVLYQLLGNSLERTDRPKEAVVAYQRFLALAPQHSLAPAVRSIVERLSTAEPTGADDGGDVNPYAPH